MDQVKFEIALLSEVQQDSKSSVANVFYLLNDVEQNVLQQKICEELTDKKVKLSTNKLSVLERYP